LASRRTAVSNDFALQFQELLADSVRAESFLAVTGDTNHLAEIALAVRLPADRAEFWRTNLLTIAENWSGGRSQALPGAAAGWELKPPGDKGVFRLVRADNWTLFGWGKEALAGQDEFRKRIAKSGSPAPVPGDSWGEIFFDGPNLATVFSLLSLSPSVGESAGVRGSLPAANLALARRGSDLRLSGNMIFRESFSWQLESWQIPTNLIHEPIISFTAVQGVASLLNAFQDSFGLPSGNSPHQLFMWAGNNFPVQTLVAAPMPNADEFVRHLSPRILDRFNPLLQAHDVGFLASATNSLGAETIRWTGIPPWVTPFLSSFRDSGAEFLVAGTFQNWPGDNPPPQIFHHLLTRSNLVYYDWEIVAEHLQTWRATINIFRHLFELPRLGTDTASILCLNAVSNRLGNTVTEVTRANSNRLDFVRQGPLGLTGLELIALAHWLESSRFPLGGIGLAAPTNTLGVP
jgi:hypothetical protein